MTLPMNSMLAEAMNDGFVMVASNWQVTYLNRRAQIMFKRLDANVDGLRLWDLIPEDRQSMAYRELHRAVDQQITTEFDVFYPNLYSWHEVRAVPTTDELCLILRDITDRQWLLRREAERAYLRNLFHDAPIAIRLTRGPYHQYEYLNSFARRLIGNRNIEGLTVREAFPEIEGQGFLELLDNVYRTGEPYYGEEALVRYDRNGDGQLVDAYFTFSFQALRGFDAQVSGILGMSIEVTEQVVARQRNEQLAAENAKLLKALNELQNK